MSESKQTILVVDDNPATLYSTGRVLRGAGFNVLEAKTGAQAIELAARMPDLIILDINLPDFSGFEVCRRLRAASSTAVIPIVHLSATFVNDVDKVQGLDTGADGYLTHPVEPPVLVATIRAFLRARQAESAKQQLEQDFRTIFDRAPNGIALLDANLRMVQANPAFERLLGRPRTELLGVRFDALLPAELRPSVAGIGEFLRRDGAWGGLLPMVHAAGTLVYMELSVSMYSVAGVWLAIATDVTEKRRIELEREQLLLSERAARTELERANHLKDEFLATLSHELRTPLAVIVGWADVFLRGKFSEGELTRGLETIARNAKAQQQLISDLLDVSRITAGKLRLETESLDLAVLTERAVQSMTPAADAKEIRIKRVLNPSAGAVLGDPARLQQVIWNLVNNAVKFTPKGGVVQVVVDRVDSSVRLTVSDNGQGIKPDFLPYIFERFRQQDTVLSRTHGGLGLGLAIVKHLVELHGGTVWAESKGEGQGATFVVQLPLMAVHAAQSAEVATPPAAWPLPVPTKPSLQGLTIVTVDDDADGRYLVKRLLTEAGAKVLENSSAAQALHLLEGTTPDVLICDIGMPDCDGYAFIRAVRARGLTHRDLPAIALTAFARTEDRQRAMLAGYQVHLAKPVESAELLAAVQSLLGRTTQE